MERIQGNRAMIQARPQPRRYSTLFFLVVTIGALVLSQKCSAAAQGPPEVAAWEIRYGTDPSNLESTITASGDVTDYTVTGLAPDTTYHFSITAVSPSGVHSSPSALVTYQTPVATAPAMVTVHLYEIDLAGNRTIVATHYFARKERAFFQLGIEP